MFEEILRNRSFYDQKIADTAVKLERARINNERLDTLKAEREKLQSLSDIIHIYRDTLSLVNRVATVEVNSFQNRRIEYLNSQITAAISEIFPSECLEASIDCDFSRKDICELTLRDREGNEYIPDITDGKLMQYLISFAAVAGITRGLGGTNLFIDEAFGVSDIDRLPDLGDAIQKQINNGLQVILISQNPALYANLDSHVIHLHKDVETRQVIVDGEEG